MPCRNRVFCNICHDPRPMSVYMTGKKPKGGKRYLYFRCRNENCPREKQNIRGYMIMDSIAEILPELVSKLSKDAYKTYLKETKELTQTAKKTIRSESIILKSKAERLRKVNTELSQQIMKLADQRMIDEINKQIANNLDEIDRINSKIAENDKKLNQRDKDIKRYTPEEFDEMIRKLPEIFAKSSVVRKDLILREIFSNFYFDNEKIVGFSVKEPFATLLNVKPDDVVSLGGG